MMLGAMNDPRRPVLEEIRAVAAEDFAYIDLVLEPPGADPGALPLSEVVRALRETGLPVIGHTARGLPIGSPFPEVSRAAREVVARSLEVFAVLGARLVTVHPDPEPPSGPAEEILGANAESVVELDRCAEAVGVYLMVENIPGVFNEVAGLRPLIESSPRVGFQLDLGHAALQPRPAGDTGPSARAAELLAAFGGRLRHVHVSDNYCRLEDLHLPVGAGRIAWAEELARLRAMYDGSITVAVPAGQAAYRRISADVVRRLWAGGA